MTAGTQETDAAFEAPCRAPAGEDLVVDLDGYQGPLDVLLTLARQQKVDLARLSILDLADQYLAFIAEARHLRLELAADYLVMAAWLAYLKSRLLLPRAPEDEGPSAAELAADLTLRLRQLQAMREAGERLMRRPRLGSDVFARGEPEDVTPTERPVYEVTLHDLLKSYAARRGRTEVGTLRIAPPPLVSMDEALHRLRRVIGGVPDWQVLNRFLPEAFSSDLVRRSAVAATFAASLELVRAGDARLRQDSPFGPIYLRRGSG